MCCVMAPDGLQKHVHFGDKPETKFKENLTVASKCHFFSLLSCVTFWWCVFFKIVEPLLPPVRQFVQF